jgi:signal transduction histidine kinase/Tfp pilus assembly protein PilF
MIKNIIFLSLILITFKSTANNSINSISSTLEKPLKTEVDSASIAKIIGIADVYFISKKIDSSYNYYKKALELAKSINSKPQIAECLFNIAQYYQETYQYNTAIEYYENALILFKELGKMKMVARIKNSIGHNYSSLNDGDKAIDYYFKSIMLCRELKDKKSEAYNYIDIGNLYYENGNYDFAKKYYDDALGIYINLKDTLGIANSYTNIANALTDADVKSKGVDYFFQSIELQEILNYKEGIALNYNNIGDYYLKLNKYDDAKTYFLKALEYTAELVNNEDLNVIIYYNLSDLENSVGNYDEAIFYGTKSLNLSDLLGLPDLKKDNLKNISYAYENMGDKVKALDFLKQSVIISDTISKINNRKKVLLFNALHKLEESNSKISQLSLKNENEKKIMYFLVIAISVFGFFVIVLIYQQTSKKKAYNLLEFKNYQIRRMNEEIKIQTKNLKLSNDTKDQFFSIIAHDLKNPFNSIRGFTELLIENIATYDQEKKLKFLKIIKGSTTKASDLLNNLLIWANSQSGTIKFNPVKIELVKQVSDAISLVEIQAINKEISIFNSVYHNLFVLADANMLNTILRNLLSNAIKFTNAKGEIYIGSSIKDNNVIVSVKDNGIGMSKDAVENLFSMDNKLSGIGTANEQGSGLGLILCKDFIEKNGGEIWVNSTPNKGSEFLISLPIYND